MNKSEKMQQLREMLRKYRETKSVAQAYDICEFLVLNVDLERAE